MLDGNSMEVHEQFECLVADLAHTLYRKTHLYDFEDLFQIGLQSVVRLEKSFDASRSQRITFFTKCIRRDMVKFIKKHNKVFSNVPLPNETSCKKIEQLWESLPDMGAEDTEMVRMLVNGLSKRDVARRLMLTMQEVQVRLEKIGESIG